MCAVWEKNLNDLLANSPKFEITSDNSEPLRMSSHMVTWWLYQNIMNLCGPIYLSLRDSRQSHYGSNTEQHQQKLSACQGKLVLLLVVVVAIVAGGGGLKLAAAGVEAASVVAGSSCCSHNSDSSQIIQILWCIKLILNRVKSTTVFHQPYCICSSRASIVKIIFLKERSHIYLTKNYYSLRWR